MNRKPEPEQDVELTMLGSYNSLTHRLDDAPRPQVTRYLAHTALADGRLLVTVSDRDWEQQTVIQISQSGSDPGGEAIAPVTEYRSAGPGEDDAEQRRAEIEQWDSEARRVDGLNRPAPVAIFSSAHDLIPPEAREAEVVQAVIAAFSRSDEQDSADQGSPKH